MIYFLKKTDMMNQENLKYCFDFTASTEKGKKFLKKNGFETFEDVLELYAEKERRKKIQYNTNIESVIINNKIILCKKCNSGNIKQISVQTRSLDEGETQYIYCKSCTARYTI
jgi:DNA-directed RNA polymerase subunit M/transcription elongation factor TFIIS